MEVTAQYVGNKRVEARCGRTGTELIFDQPAPEGLGESLNPVEGLLSALCGCMLTTAAYAAGSLGLDPEGASAAVTCEMADGPRIASITAVVSIPASCCPAEKRGLIEKMVTSCPVSRALSPDIRRDVRFLWI
ncbi:MAG: OsmC family protein [Mesosutterella sp.]|nr:OsmC family protein [Mesosutterella sp.]